MRQDEWAAAIKADAVRRGLPELAPLLDGLIKAAQVLRDADWNASADRTTQAEPDSLRGGRDR